MTPPNQDHSSHSVWRSFGHAFAGAAVLFRTQRSVRIQAAVAALMIAAGLLLGLPASSWCWLILAITMVFSAEAFNTAIEFLSDVVCSDFSPAIKKVKDVASAAVLLAVIGAVAIGVLVLGPPLWNRLCGG
jgi:diacylglycerol kinase (ATP)